MGFPAARLGDMTATGDAITGPGLPTVLIANMPASRMGDLVAGAACTGSIVKGSATVLLGGVPAVRVSDSVTGANPASGAPVSTVVGPPGALTVLIGG